MRNTKETVDFMLKAAAGKAATRAPRHFLLSVMAGVYIGFGAALALKIAGNLNPEWGNLIRLIFGLLFPVGLLMVLTAGASLFTGEVMFMPSSLAAGGVGAGKCLRYLTVSYAGNLVGSVLLAYLVFWSGIMADRGPDGGHPLAAYAVNLASGKTSLPFMTAFVRGILCNWLVCLAVFMSLTSDDGVSKAVLMWPPITAFVAMGMEHSVANMFFIPLGILLGSDPAIAQSGVTALCTWKSFFIANLIPVTLGNIVGGALFVGLPYLYISGLGGKETKTP